MKAIELVGHLLKLPPDTEVFLRETGENLAREIRLETDLYVYTYRDETDHYFVNGLSKYNHLITVPDAVIKTDVAAIVCENNNLLFFRL